MLAAHGTAGLFGILFIGFFAEVAWNGVSDGLFYGNAAQLWRPGAGRAGRARLRLRRDLRAAEADRRFMPLRASEREEATGMDVVQHGEEAYVTGEGAILRPPRRGRQRRGGARGRPGLALLYARSL